MHSYVHLTFLTTHRTLFYTRIHFLSLSKSTLSSFTQELSSFFFLIISHLITENKIILPIRIWSRISEIKKHTKNTRPSSPRSELKFTYALTLLSALTTHSWLTNEKHSYTCKYIGYMVVLMNIVQHSSTCNLPNSFDGLPASSKSRACLCQFCFSLEPKWAHAPRRQKGAAEDAAIIRSRIVCRYSITNKRTGILAAANISVGTIAILL